MDGSDFRPFSPKTRSSYAPTNELAGRNMRDSSEHGSQTASRLNRSQIRTKAWSALYREGARPRAPQRRAKLLVASDRSIDTDARLRKRRIARTRSLPALGAVMSSRDRGKARSRILKAFFAAIERCRVDLQNLGCLVNRPRVCQNFSNVLVLDFLEARSAAETKFGCALSDVSEVAGFDSVGLGQNHCSLNDVPQLSQVPRPGVGPHRLHCFRRESESGFTGPPRKKLELFLRAARQVHGAIARRRN